MPPTHTHDSTLVRAIMADMVIAIRERRAVGQRIDQLKDEARNAGLHVAALMFVAERCDRDPEDIRRATGNIDRYLTDVTEEAPQ